MVAKTKPYKRIFFMGIIVIALGVVFSTTLREVNSSLGTVFIAIGGLLFIVAMSKKRNEEKEGENNSKNLN